jgi:membrane protease YdiL (CAAX protease family)
LEYKILRACSKSDVLKRAYILYCSHGQYVKRNIAGEDTLKKLVEPLILYIVLFLPGAIPDTPPPDPAAFSAGRELARIFLYNIPSFALIWYLLLQGRSLREWGVGLPGKRDLFSVLLAFPGLALIGVTISLIAPLFTDISAGAVVSAPSTVSGWIVMILSCLSTGYLEESFFRFYLLARLGELGIKTGRLIFVSVVFFAFCHIWEGPWGVLNAVLAGTLLTFVFLHYRALHGIALAHGLYNALVYTLGV